MIQIKSLSAEAAAQAGVHPNGPSVPPRIQSVNFMIFFSFPFLCLARNNIIAEI
jgi:hypothetical protein